MESSVRKVNSNEETLIFSFLFLASRMLEGNEPIQKAVTDPFLKKYWFGWGRPGDLGVVSIDGATGIPISCSWVRLFSKEEAGTSFVGEGFPELATGTVEKFRGKGVGTVTLQSLIELAKPTYPGICLSVREDNPAVKLYERLSFKMVPGSEMKNRIGTKSFNMLLQF